METKKLNIKNIFNENVCSFQMAKRIKEKGITCANTYFAYDEDGQITTGGWLSEISSKYATFYPCVNTAMAIVIAEQTNADLKKIDVYKTESSYRLSYNDFFEIETENIADLFLEFWLRFKK